MQRPRRSRVSWSSLYIASPAVCAASGVAMAGGIAVAPFVLAATLVVTLVLTLTNTWSLLLDVSDEDRAPA